MTNSVLYVFQLISALAGVALSLYLFVHHTRLKIGVQESASFCSLGAFADCDSVNVSQYSELFGIPIAAFGALAYFLISALLLSARPTDPAFRTSQRGVAALATLCALVDLGLFAIQIVELKNVCLFCLLTYGVTFFVLFSSIKLVTGRFTLSGWKTALLQGGSSPSPSVLGLLFLSVLLFIAVLTLVPAAIQLGSQTYTYVNSAVEQFYEQFPQRPATKIDPFEGDGTFGNPSAKVRIVEFSDFECPHCRKAAFTIHTALKILGKRVFFIYKHFPLDSACNPAVTHQMHPNACSLARLGYCAAKKDEFWKFHDLVFFSWEQSAKSSGPHALDDAIKNGVFSGVFTPSEIQKCLGDEKSLQAVTADIRLANELGVKGTPSIYIDGKQVTVPLSLESLSRLVDSEDR